LPAAILAGEGKLKNNRAIAQLLACSVVAASLILAPCAHAAQQQAKTKRVKVTYQSKQSAKKPVRHVVVDEIAIGGALALKSGAALVVDQNDGRSLYSKNTQSRLPIASITKLMTAMVVLDAALPLDETIRIDAADFDALKHTNSRLGMGTALSRGEMLRLALMSSENRAAAALGRTYTGGLDAFVAAMNRKAVELGMWSSRFVDPTGLSSENVSTAEDLAKMVAGAYGYPLIREFTTTPDYGVETQTGRSLLYRNTNGLIKSSTWEIGLSKTGYISEAGRCLVMQATIAARAVIIVLLDSSGKQTRIGDANRIKKWMESGATARDVTLANSHG
jgi:serine-type D-Ala-D-Ala endopeptidase (penicillin-binding protein 7)